MLLIGTSDPPLFTSWMADPAQCLWSYTGPRTYGVISLPTINNLNSHDNRIKSQHIHWKTTTDRPQHLIRCNYWPFLMQELKVENV